MYKANKSLSIDTKLVDLNAINQGCLKLNKLKTMLPKNHK